MAALGTENSQRGNQQQRESMGLVSMRFQVNVVFNYLMMKIVILMIMMMVMTIVMMMLILMVAR